MVGYRNTAQGPAALCGFTHAFTHSTQRFLPSENSFRCPHLLWEALFGYNCRKQVVTSTTNSVSGVAMMKATPVFMNEAQVSALCKTLFGSDLTAVQTGCFFGHCPNETITYTGQSKHANWKTKQDLGTTEALKKWFSSHQPFSYLYMFKNSEAWVYSTTCLWNTH